MKTHDTHDARSGSTSADPDRAQRAEVIECAIAWHRARTISVAARVDYAAGRIGSMAEHEAEEAAAAAAFDVAIEALVQRLDAHGKGGSDKHHGPSAGR